VENTTDPLEQISRFNVEPFVLRAVCVIHLREGGRVPVFALSFIDPAFSTSLSYEPLIAELNSALGAS
jgi:hypothetical protein